MDEYFTYREHIFEIHCMIMLFLVYMYIEYFYMTCMAV